MMLDYIEDIENSDLWKSLIDGLCNMDNKSEYIQHHYRDRSAEIDDGTSNANIRGGVLLRFPVILHAVLDAVESDGFSEVLSWQPHERCFIIHKSKTFVSGIMQKYFKQTKMTSFQRQLNLYGFQRLTRGEDKGGYYHELFLRGKAFLAHRVHRIRIKGTGCRKKSNPMTEPDFSRMPPMLSSFGDKSSGHILSSSLPAHYLERECNVSGNHECRQAEVTNMAFHCSPRIDERLSLREGMKYNTQLFLDTCLNNTTHLDRLGQPIMQSSARLQDGTFCDFPNNFGEEKDFSDIIMLLIRH
jgi:HSF-type DNA-binding